MFELEKAETRLEAVEALRVRLCDDIISLEKAGVKNEGIFRALKALRKELTEFCNKTDYSIRKREVRANDQSISKARKKKTEIQEQSSSSTWMSAEEGSMP